MNTKKDRKFLNISDEQVAFIEIKASLSEAFSRLRTKKKLPRAAVVRKLDITDSILTNMESVISVKEAMDKTISIDLLVHSLLALGVTKNEIALIILTVP